MDGKKLSTLLTHPVAKLARGEAVWGDDFAKAMAEGKKPETPIDWDKILKPTSPNVMKKDDSAIITYDDTIHKKMCPKCSNSGNPFKLFDEARWCSDGEDVKCYNIKCQGTESSPCSFCSDKGKVTRVAPGCFAPSPSPSPAKQKQRTSEFVEAVGYSKDLCEGEEETPKKILAHACKWCQLDPCIIHEDESREEGRMIVDNLNVQGTELNKVRCALCRMHARQLGYVGERHILPHCDLYIEANFVEPGEERTGFKPKTK